MILNAFSGNKAFSYEDAFKAKDVTSECMDNAISDWYKLFYDIVPDEKEDPCQRIPYTIVNKLTKTTFSEYSVTAKDEFTKSVLNALNKKKIQAMHAAMIGGMAFIKPYITSTGIAFNVIFRSNAMIFGKDDQGIPYDIGTAEKTSYGSKYYTLLERRSIGQDGRLTIKNMLYESVSDSDLGKRVPLSTLYKYQYLQDEYTFSTPIGLGVSIIRCPVPNCVDGSNDPVSVYAAATGLIHRINENENQLLGEFERGKSRLIVSADMLGIRTDFAGNQHKVFEDNIFTGLDENPEETGITIFSPALREASFLARKTEYLRNVESMIGLKRGLLSEVESAERTATEITSSAGDYALTIGDFQNMWKDALLETVKLSGTIAGLYNVSGAHEINPDDITIDWGNGVLYDEEKTWTDYKAMVASGLLKPEIAVGWYFGMPTDTEAQLNKIRAKYMPQIESMMQEGGE